MTMNINLNATNAFMYRSELIKGLTIALTTEGGVVTNLDGTSPLAQLRDIYSILKDARDSVVPDDTERHDHILSMLARGPSELTNVAKTLAAFTGVSLSDLVKTYIKEMPSNPVMEKFEAELKEIEELIERASTESAPDHEEGCGECEACLAVEAAKKSLRTDSKANIGALLSKALHSLAATPVEAPAPGREGMGELLKMFLEEASGEAKPMSQKEKDNLVRFTRAIAMAFTKKVTSIVDLGIDGTLDYDETFEALKDLAKSAGLEPSDVAEHVDFRQSAKPEEEFLKGAVEIPLSAFRGMSEADFKETLSKAAASVDGSNENAASQLGEALQKAFGGKAKVRVVTDPKELAEILGKTK